ncbi:hypothetical protein [Fimbriiglobus ruber]|uniref:DUF4274 domain-containing protein n=1 Tax=Fimbriiglobus ruber TaxID=1908690 RepID=A0A225D3I0_9BACT|nr:hypothetical protein [Fimbriiglobus ruber]OWK36151.1 hypothetical protein FRUB_08714 [Fimbriiglobus ruber]
MALSVQQRKRVAWLIDGHLSDDYDESTFAARWEREFASLSSPEEMYLFTSESHPAQEPVEWQRVLDSPLCDMGTALLIFWRNSPVYYYWDEPTGGWDRERYDLVREIERWYTSGWYQSAVVRFDPAAFKRLNFLTGHSAAELERVPALMRRPSTGESVLPLVAGDFEWGEGFEPR